MVTNTLEVSKIKKNLISVEKNALNSKNDAKIKQFKMFQMFILSFKFSLFLCFNQCIGIKTSAEPKISKITSKILIRVLHLSGFLTD